MPYRTIEEKIKIIRDFSRMYVQKIGVLNERPFGMNLSITQVRVLQEIAMQKSPTATEISKSLDLDCGYLSRILNFFVKEDLITKERSIKDARQHKISLTKKGVKLCEQISQKANENVSAMISNLSLEQQLQLIHSMSVISLVLTGRELSERAKI